MWLILPSQPFPTQSVWRCQTDDGSFCSGLRFGIDRTSPWLFDKLWLNYPYINKACLPANQPTLEQSIPLLNELLKFGNFEMLYESESTAILKKR